MTFTIFITSLIFLCIVALAAFIVSFSKKALWLCLIVPLISLSGSSIYFSYKSVLGFPAKLSWEELSDKFTVIYFKADGKKSITLWLLESEDSRVVTLPFQKEAENAMEGERKTMGEGTPVTFKKFKNKSNHAGNSSALMQGGTHSGEGLWRYIVLSKGEPIPGNALRPKEY